MGRLFDRHLSRTIVELAAPVVLAMLTQTGINLVDTIMVGRLSANYSIAGQSAIGYSLILLWAVGGFLSSIQVGTQAIVARRYGEGNLAAAGQALTNSLAIAFLLGTIVSIGAYLAMPFVFPLIDKNPNVVALGTEYAGYRMLGVLSMVATVSYKSFFDGISQTYVHMVAAIVMNVANLILNWVLIFGVGPIEPMYVGGAGLGSLISTYIGLLVMMIWSFAPKVRRDYRPYAISNMNSRVLASIISVSIPSGTATVFVMSGFGLFITIVGLLDARNATDMVAHIPLYDAAVHNTLAQVRNSALWSDPFLNAVTNRPPIYTSATKIIMDTMSLSFMSMIALGTATASLVGQSLGAEKPELAVRYGWTSVQIGGACMVVFGALAFVFPDWFVSVFNSDPAVIEAGRSSLRLMSISAIFIAVGLILAQALFGAGYSRYVMWVEVTLHIVCLVPLAYVLGLVLDFGLLGIWSAAFAYIFFLAAAMAWKFWEGGWKNVML